ncbi:MAG: DEAD/DEAH box helicase [Patescibacteria group bacterium]|nr:DEAD/DEAH box helicase [Patescibacteria group bacterium]
MKLRPYQHNGVSSTFLGWESGLRSLLGVMPTGCGKTVVFASVIRRIFPKRTMVLAHRAELVWQARDKIKQVTGFNVDVEMAEYKASNQAGLFYPSAQVIVSTVQTHCAGGDGAGRMSKFDPMDFGLLVIDEAHHAVSPSYRRIIEYYKTNPNLKILGVTATPDRSDEEALGQVFEEVAFDYEILDAIKDGWLVPIEQQFVSIDDLDFSKIRTTAGDLNQGDLDAVMKSEKNLHGVASATIEIIGGRRGIGFASSVEHARLLADIFNRHKPGMANYVHGGTDKEERKMIISDFAAGRYQFLWNCGVFTEGFDDAGVEVISMARPTKSRCLYAQMAGRATRPHNSIAHTLNDVENAAKRRWMIQKSVKPSCLIIDFVGNSGKHKLATTADILGGNVSDEVLDLAIKSAQKSRGPVRMDRNILEEEERLEQAKARAAEESARKARLVANASYKTTKVDPFDILQIKPVTKTREWNKNKVMSEKCKKIVRERFGLNPDELSYENGMNLVHEFFRRIEGKLCTFPQAKILKKFGCSTDVTFQDASAMIDAIARNKWKGLPASFQLAPKEAPTQDSINEPLVDGDVPF